MRFSFEVLATAGLSVANAQADTGVLDPGPSAAGGDRRLAGECPQGFVTCVNGLVEGTQQTCEDACDGACCVGNRACKAFTGEVCKDNVSCMGDWACLSANIGSVVEGCSERDACYDSEIGSVVKGCQGEGACFDAFISSELFNCCNTDYADSDCYTATSLPASCPSTLSQFTCHSDTGSGQGNKVEDAGELPKEECAVRCTQNPACAAFTIKSHGGCVLKSAYTLTKDAITSGKETCVKNGLLPTEYQ